MAWVQTLGVPGAQIAVVLLAGIMEGTGVPWPGSLLIAAAGMASGGGLGSLFLLSLLFTLGYVAGALVQYALGRIIGPRLLGLLPSGSRRRVMEIMEKLGPAAVFWVRPFAIGNYVSIPAGMMQMPVARFLLYTVAGIWPWAVAVVWLGAWAGPELAPVQRWLDRWLWPGTLSLAGLTLLFIVGQATWRRVRLRRLPAPVHSGAEESGD